MAVTQLLLANGASILTTNSQGENVIQYAAIHCVNVKLFEILLEHLFSSTAISNSAYKPMEILLMKNDAGQSILHMLVNRPNTFVHIKMLLDAIDQHLAIESPGSGIWDVDNLLPIYRSYILNFDKRMLPSERQKEKMAVLNQPESLSGRSPLFLALKQEAIPTVFVLLAHFANPMVADRSGVDCITLVKDEDRYKSVNSYVMKTVCWHIRNPIDCPEKGLKRKYTRRVDSNSLAECGIEKVTSPKLFKKSN